MKDIFYISKLIIEKKLKVLSSSKKSNLEQYYKKHPFSKDIDFDVIVQKISEYSTIDKDKAWERISNKIKVVNKKPTFFKANKLWFKYAVAASVAILMSIPFVFDKDDIKTVDTAIVNNNIESGIDKATLTLEDGSNVTLGKGKNFQTKNLNSNGKELIYNSNSTSDLEIAYNYLTIPRGGQFYVKLEDGTQIWLNSESKIKYPKKFIKGEAREVKLIYGEAYFDVSPSTAHNGSKFRVVAQMQKIEVLGTEFNVKAYSDEDNIYTTLVEGKVSIYNGIVKKMLKPNQQSIINVESKDIAIANIDVYNATSWKSGIFSFKDKPLKDIMKTLSRWYNVDIVFANKEFENVKFNGVLNKKQNIENILSAIKTTNNINYKIDNNKITIK